MINHYSFSFSTSSFISSDSFLKCRTYSLTPNWSYPHPHSPASIHPKPVPFLTSTFFSFSGRLFLWIQSMKEASILRALIGHKLWQNLLVLPRDWKTAPRFCLGPAADWPAADFRRFYWLMA